MFEAVTVTNLKRFQIKILIWGLIKPTQNMNSFRVVYLTAMTDCRFMT
jgi:hypothetical protein